MAVSRRGFLSGLAASTALMATMALPRAAQAQLCSATWTCLTPIAGDNGPAINAALAAGNVMLGRGDFTISTRIDVPWAHMLVGSGDGTKLRKLGNIDLIRLGPQSVLRDFYYDSFDPNWVGGAIRCDAGDKWQVVHNINGWAKEFFIKCFGQDTGSRITVNDCSPAVYDGTRYCIQLPEDPEVPGNGIRTFNNVVCNGTWGFDLGGAADTYIRRCNFTNFRYRDNTLGADVESCRFATGGPIEVRGSNHSLFNNRCQYPFHLMPSLNNSDIWQYRGAGVVNMGMGPNVRIHI